MLEGSRRSAILAVNIARRARKDAARHGREGGFLVLDTPSQTWDSFFVNNFLLSYESSNSNSIHPSSFRPFVLSSFLHGRLHFLIHRAAVSRKENHSLRLTLLHSRVVKGGVVHLADARLEPQRRHRFRQSDPSNVALFRTMVPLTAAEACNRHAATHAYQTASRTATGSFWFRARLQRHRELRYFST